MHNDRNKGDAAKSVFVLCQLIARDFFYLANGQANARALNRTLRMEFYDQGICDVDGSVDRMPFGCIHLECL
ncbi:hypothetical protein [Pseudoramibacter alactolyticus]|uniref:hypothetical protein n=1 Tax=Pseudoramibacter alactolyticus TaxID=113287 RepID=UPI00058ECE7F|nr:hypothetical protein [Pseudoramibacter alactolyticus]